MGGILKCPIFFLKIKINKKILQPDFFGWQEEVWLLNCFHPFFAPTKI
jgi:hypothetical protein